VLAACPRADSGEEAGAKPEHPGPVTVAIAHVDRRPMVDWVGALGRLEVPPGQDVKVGALAAGRVTRVLKQEGERVKVGEVLAEIENPSLRDQVDQTEASYREADVALRLARARLDRLERGLAQGVVPRRDADEAQAQASAAEASLARAGSARTSAHALQARSSVTSPLAGTVIRVLVHAGEPVDGAGQPIVEISAVLALQFRGALAVSDLVRLRPGQGATVHVTGLDGGAPARVLTVSPAVDPSTDTGQVRLSLDATPEGWRAGMLADARVEVGRREEALTVPIAALHPGDPARLDSATVLRIEADSTVVPIPVTRGAEADGRVAIEGDLDGGEAVVGEGGYSLPAGTRVQAAP
jgi:RND family efflux transporter MFP subunit